MPSRETLVFIPGLNNSSSVWRPVIEALPDDIDSRTVDLPPLDDVDAIADVAVTDLPEQFVMVGHSFGGYIALATLVRNPERVRGVVLVNSTSRADTARQRSTRLDRIDQLSADRYEQTAMAAAEVSYHPNNILPTSESAERLLTERRSMIREYGFERFVAHSRAAAKRPDRTDAVRDGGAPVLVITAEDDRVIPTVDQQAMAQDAGAALRVLPCAGHMLPAEQPAALASAIADWLPEVLPVTTR